MTDELALIREFKAYLAQAREHRNELRGVPIEGIDSFLVGAGRVSFGKNGLWEPSEDGARAVILPVRADPEGTGSYGVLSVSPFLVPWDGLMIDMIAWSPESPSRWALRRGVALFIGAAGIQFLWPDPVRVWASPLAWLTGTLAEAVEGVCLLTTDPWVRAQILRDFDRIVAEDDAHARELRQARAWHPNPLQCEFLVRAADAREAAA